METRIYPGPQTKLFGLVRTVDLATDAFVPTESGHRDPQLSAPPSTEWCEILLAQVEGAIERARRTVLHLRRN